MEDIIIKLVNEAADARKEKYENELAFIKKTTAVDANAMGILSYLMDHYFQTDDEKQNLLYNHVRLVYSWLDYSSALPIKMFIEVGSGDRIWRNFRNLYDLYIKGNSTLTFVEWMAETEKRPTMPVELRPYQIDIARRGVTILRRHGILYLAMEVRTGKTLTALQIAYNVGATNVLFCTRVKAMSSIQRDYEAAEYPYQLDIINYESLHKITKAQEQAFDLIICDEAHSLGAFPQPSERARMVRRLVGHKNLILLSGTPTPESYSQLFHQFWVSWNSPFQEATFYSWAKQYVRIQSRYFYNREVKDYKDADRDAVMEKCEHLFIKFSREDAGFAEQVDEQIITVRMKDSTLTGIERLKKNRVLTTKEGTVIADTAVKLMSKLHQLHSGTVIVDQPIGPHDHYAFDMSKANAIKDLFTGKKIAIFYKFQAELGILQWVFAGRIVETPEQFNAAGPDKVYLTQIQSGREGINLSAADALVMYNIDFSAVSYWQARARLQSKDRKTPAMVYWIFSEGGIEFKIYEAVKAKKNYTLAYFVKDYNIEPQKQKDEKYAIIVFMMLSMRGMAAEKPGLWDAIKEAGKGVVWMIRVEVCKIDMALFSKEGLNIFYADYKCYHKDHNTIYQTK